MYNTAIFITNFNKHGYIIDTQCKYYYEYRNGGILVN